MAQCWRLSVTAACSMLRDVDLVSASSHPAASLVATTSSCGVANAASVSAIAAAAAAAAADDDDVSSPAHVRAPMCLVINLDGDNAQDDMLELAIAARLRNGSLAVVRGSTLHAQVLVQSRLANYTSTLPSGVVTKPTFAESTLSPLAMTGMHGGDILACTTTNVQHAGMLDSPLLNVELLDSSLVHGFH